MTSASTRQGLPEPLTILSGGVIRIAPFGGSLSRFIKLARPNLLLPLRLVPWDKDSLTPLRARLRGHAVTSRQALPGEIAHRQSYSDKPSVILFGGHMARTGH